MGLCGMERNLIIRTVVIGYFALVSVVLSADPGVAFSDGLRVDRREIQYIYDSAPAAVRSQLETDQAARYEVLVQRLVAKRILRQLQALAGEDDPADYFKFQNKIFLAAREFDEQRFQERLTIPDLDPIARERYRVSKEDIARVEESRSLSHILLLCSESCDSAAKLAELEVIRQRLLEGESFADLAAEFSQDPGSRQRGGRLSRPIFRADKNVDETFRETAFALEEVGDLSGIVRSRFGFHVMRLEEVIPSRLYTFEEVKPALLKEIEMRYREDAYKAYYLSLGPGDDLQVDYRALDEIMGPLPAETGSD